MNLYLLRHGHAEKEGVLYAQDRLRPLSPDGVEEIKIVAKALRRLDARFDLMLTSPVLRAKQTAEIVAKTLGYGKEPELTESLGGTLSPDLVARDLESLPADVTALLVGHSPQLGKLIAYLISNDESTKVVMKEGTLAWIEISNPTFRTGRLRWLIPVSVWRK